MQMKQPEAPQMPVPEVAKLTAQDLEDREDFEYLLSIMERQGGIHGTIQPVDLNDAKVYKGRIESFIKGESPEGPITTLFDNIIFDFDGVLYDTTHSIYTAVKLTLAREAEEGVPIPSSIEEIANAYQAPYQDYYKRFGIIPDHHKKLGLAMEHKGEETFKKDFRDLQAKIDKEHHTQANFYPEVKEVLDRLKAAKKDNPKLKLHIVSASSPEQVRDNLIKYDLTEYFDEKNIHAESHGKTKMIQLIADEGDQGRTIMIGDLPSDIKDAQKVEGVKTIAIARGQIEQERLGMYLPDYVVTDLNGLFDLKSLSRELREKQ